MEPENTPEDRLTNIVLKTCRELKLPEEHIVRFALTVADCARGMRTLDIDYNAENVFDAINAYEMLIIEGPTTTSLPELDAYAATTAAYFLAKEAALKDEGLRALFGPEKRRAY